MIAIKQRVGLPLNSLTRKIPAWSVYLLGVLLFASLVYDLFTGRLGVDPVKAVEHSLGYTGLWFLVAGLAVTPLRKFAGLNLIKFRRAIGVTSFFFILAHLLTWLLLDMQLLWGQMLADIAKRPYITIGMAAFLMLIPLAMTSNNFSIRRLGPVRWRNLHKLTYVLIPLASVHFVMVVKGWQPEPFVWLGVVVGLLVLRRV